MPGSGRTDSQLFDLMALGLTWVQAESHTSPPPGWTGNGVLQTLRQVGAISDTQYHTLASGPSQNLRNYFTGRAELIWPTRSGKPARGAVSRAIDTSSRQLIVIINTAAFAGDKMFIPGGYRLMMTNVGLRYAADITRQYQRELPRDTFWGQWISHKRQMAGMNATTRGRRAPAEG
jgi:hypothetical protein